MPALSVSEDLRTEGKSRLKGGCRQDCLPHKAASSKRRRHFSGNMSAPGRADYQSAAGCQPAPQEDWQSAAGGAGMITKVRHKMIGNLRPEVLA